MSRPKRIFTDEEVNKILELYEEGKTDAQVAKVFQLPRKTFLDAVKNIKELPAAIKKVKEIPNHRVEKAMYERAIGYEHKATKFFCHNGVIVGKDYIKRYPPEVPAGVFWLCNRDKKRWRNVQRVDVEGQVNHRIIEIVRADGRKTKD